MRCLTHHCEIVPDPWMHVQFMQQGQGSDLQAAALRSRTNLRSGICLILITFRGAAPCRRFTRSSVPPAEYSGVWSALLPEGKQFLERCWLEVLEHDRYLLSAYPAKNAGMACLDRLSKHLIARGHNS